MPPYSGDSHVCYHCIGDEFLRAEVESTGAVAPCAFCDNAAAGISVRDLGEAIKDVLERHFQFASDRPTGVAYALAADGMWVRPGSRLDATVLDLADIDFDLTAAVCDWLYASHPFDPKDDEEHPYDPDAHYERLALDGAGYREDWQYFKSELLTRSRFFSRSGADILDRMFADLDALLGSSDISFVRTLTPGDPAGLLYRARVCLNEIELKGVLALPVEGIAPPPSRAARAGRMNAAGISVFYGALDPETCISEVRPPVGCHVVIGAFSVVRPLRLLNFDALANVNVEGSLFDRTFAVREARAAFLSHFVEECSRPILPGDQDTEYLPTQVVAEYLASRTDMNLDGVMFAASQTDGAGTNIVLFYRSSLVAPYDLPGDAEVLVRTGTEYEDDETSISVYEYVRRPAIELAVQAPLLTEATGFFDPGVFLGAEGPGAVPVDFRDPVLRLEVDQIQVRRIKGVSYTAPSRTVNRHRSKNQ
jgi:hypothetical protein